MYAIPWFITYLANKFEKGQTDLLLKFWDKISKKNDPLFLMFILVAFVNENKDQILSEGGQDCAKLPEVMTNLKIRNIETINRIWNEAEKFSN